MNSIRERDLRSGLQLLREVGACADDWRSFARAGVSALPSLVASEITTLSVCDLHACALEALRGSSGAALPDSMAATLTARECDVLRWVRAGKTDRDIGTLLGCSHRTVQKHLQRVYTKLGVETRTAAVMRMQQQAAHH